MKSIGEFILNGSLFGLMRGYNYNKEGHAYGFRELEEDLRSAVKCTEHLKHIVHNSANLFTFGNNSLSN